MGRIFNRLRVRIQESGLASEWLKRLEAVMSHDWIGGWGRTCGR